LRGATWTCAASGGSACGNAAGTGGISEPVDLAPGGPVIFTITASVDPSADAGALTNTATVTTPDGAVDPTPGDDSATDTTQIVRRADLNTTKDDFSSTAVAGQSTPHTIALTTEGPSPA